MGFKVQAHAFEGYWEDIGTIEAFYNANLALADPSKHDFRCAFRGRRAGGPLAALLFCVPAPSGPHPNTPTRAHTHTHTHAHTHTHTHSFYDKDAPIYTMSRFLPPSKVVDSEVSRGRRAG